MASYPVHVLLYQRAIFEVQPKDAGAHSEARAAIKQRPTEVNGDQSERDELEYMLRGLNVLENVIEQECFL